MRYYDGTGKFFSQTLAAIDYTVNWDVHGPEIEIELVTDPHGRVIDLDADTEDDLRVFLEELEADKYMYEQTGRKTGHLR